MRGRETPPPKKQKKQKQKQKCCNCISCNDGTIKSRYSFPDAAADREGNGIKKWMKGGCTVRKPEGIKKIEKAGNEGEESISGACGMKGCMDSRMLDGRAKE